MARFFILLLVVLLPLRGWTAERMVLQMQAGSPAVAQAEALDHAMPPDCALHMHMAQAASPQGTPHAAGADHKSCQSCQLCMPLATLQADAPLALAAMPQALPRAHSSRFASADAALGVKPPIS